MTKPQTTKSHMLQIRTTPAELRAIRANAKRLGLGVSELVRVLINREVMRARRAKAVNA